MANVDRQAGVALSFAATWSNLAIHGTGYRLPYNPDFSFHACTPGDAAYSLIPPGVTPGAIAPPNVNWEDWDGASRIDTFLNLVDDQAGWTAQTYPGPYGGYATRVANTGALVNGFWLCHIPGWMLPLASGRMYSLQLNRTTPPVWPGDGFATLGTPVALDVGLTITEPMHGVIVSITGTPARMGSYDYDSTRLWMNAGHVTFQADNGYLEWPQAFGFPLSTLSPRSMSVAAGCLIACKPGVTGTATPWVIVL
jgi:hypothetical protein